MTDIPLSECELTKWKKEVENEVAWAKTWSDPEKREIHLLYGLKNPKKGMKNRAHQIINIDTGVTKNFDGTNEPERDVTLLSLRRWIDCSKKGRIVDQIFERNMPNKKVLFTPIFSIKAYGDPIRKIKLDEFRLK